METAIFDCSLLVQEQVSGRLKRCKELEAHRSTCVLALYECNGNSRALCNVNHGDMHSLSTSIPAFYSNAVALFRRDFCILHFSHYNFARPGKSRTLQRHKRNNNSLIYLFRASFLCYRCKASVWLMTKRVPILVHISASG